MTKFCARCGKELKPVGLKKGIPRGNRTERGRLDRESPCGNGWAWESIGLFALQWEPQRYLFPVYLRYHYLRRLHCVEGREMYSNQLSYPKCEYADLRQDLRYGHQYAFGEFLPSVCELNCCALPGDSHFRRNRNQAPHQKAVYKTQ